MAKRLPKWALCMLCGDTLYAGPGFHPIPRECTCKATRVVPRETRGYVEWDQARYDAEGVLEPVVEYTEPGEVLQANIPVAPPTTIDDIFKSHMNNINKGLEP